MKVKKILAVVVTVLILFAGCATDVKNSESSETKDVLLQQLRTTYDKKEWFVPIKGALEGVTAEQAIWRDSSENHSIGQLTHHLLFWNKRNLARFKSLPEGQFPDSNDDTFNAFTKESWERTVTSLDSVMNALDKVVAEMEPDKLKELYPVLANISVHNAYHTGQIISVRKLQGSWNAAQGVK
jgi:hypothetical protein